MGVEQMGGNGHRLCLMYPPYIPDMLRTTAQINNTRGDIILPWHMPGDSSGESVAPRSFHWTLRASSRYYPCPARPLSGAPQSESVGTVIARGANDLTCGSRSQQ